MQHFGAQPLPPLAKTSRAPDVRERERPDARERAPGSELLQVRDARAPGLELLRARDARARARARDVRE